MQFRNSTITVNAILQPNAHERGRPSKAEELEIERALRPYFEKGYTARFTAKQTNRNIKTVAKYFNKFKEEIRGSETSDFIKRCEEEKENCLYSYDVLIHSLYQDKAEVERLIDGATKLGEWNNVTRLYRVKLKIVEDIGNIVSAKVNLTNTATVADSAKILGEAHR